MDQNNLATLVGGSGFIGQNLVRALVEAGWTVRVAVRNPAAASELKAIGEPHQVELVEANVRLKDSIAAAVSGADAVVSLVGILAQTGQQTFAALQANGAKNVAEAAKAAGVPRFVQMSAIGATADSPAEYARTKAAGEAAAKEANPETIVVRPSIVFGPGDKFFNRFADMAKISPALPLVGAETKFQPVFVGDVAAFTAKAVMGDVPPGKTYELGGPDIKTFRQLMQQMLGIMGKKRALVPLPFGVANLQAKALSVLPSPPITEDQVKLLRRDNVVSQSAIAEGRTFDAAGMTPKHLAAILPTYLG
ncbi:MAG: complex I NDUFA9 subunit family protein [Pseudomonadota bacterium]